MDRGGGGAEKSKVNCLVVTLKIMFKWYNNVVATNVAD